MKPMRSRMFNRQNSRNLIGSGQNGLRSSGRWVAAAALALAVMTAGIGCSDSTSPDITGMGISIQSGPFGGNGVIVGNPEDLVTQINITRAQLVFGGIDVRGAEDTVVFLSEEYQPLVYELNLNGLPQALAVLPATAGEYSSSRLRLETLKETDELVWEANPDMQNYSIRVEGYLNGDPGQTFLFTSTLDTEQSREFEPVVLADKETQTIVLHFDYTQWFQNETGGLVNPDDGQLAAWRSTVEENIANSVDVY